MGFIPTGTGFKGPIELLDRIVEDEGETFIFGPIDVLDKFPIDIGPLPGRFIDGDIDDDDGNRGLNDGCPYEEATNGPEFCDIKTQKIIAEKK